MRPRQWIKNGLILVVPIIQGTSAVVENLPELALGVLAFTAAASAVYLVNDLIDADRDRHHPTKRHRPIASGRLSTVTAGSAAAALFVGSALAASRLSHVFAALIASYVVIMFAYVLKLRSEPILDLAAIAAGFLIRAAAGASIVEVQPSPWFLLLVTGVAALVSVGRRVTEMADRRIEILRSRPVLVAYSAPYLDALAILGATLAMVALMGWVFEIAPDQPSPSAAFASVAPSAYVILRYLWFVFDRSAESPERLILDDRRLLLGITLALGLVVLSGL